MEPGLDDTVITHSAASTTTRLETPVSAGVPAPSTLPEPISFSRMTELAWAAGFFDGEGCAYTRFQKTQSRIRVYPIPCLVVVQTDLRPLKRFQAAVDGGRIRARKKITSLGKKPQWDWATHTGSQTVAVTELLFPYLSEPKREQLAPVLERWFAYKAEGPYFKPVCSNGHDRADPVNQYRYRGRIMCKGCMRLHARRRDERRRSAS